MFNDAKYYLNGQSKRCFLKCSRLFCAGEDGNYICAGSDEGIIFIWEKKRAEIVTALFGDFSIVNCIQPHPTACLIASSGIDPAVKLWSPMPEVSFVFLNFIKCHDKSAC